MISKIIRYIDNDGDELISIGNNTYIDNLVKERSRQIICYLLINHDEMYWRRLGELSKQDLFNELNQYFDYGIEIYPN